MFTFVLGFLSELARETGDWLDRMLPAPRLRRAARGWRRRRPFWAAMWVIAGGVEMVAIPLAPLPLMIKVGVGAMSAVGISVVLVAGGVFFLFKPDQRMFVSIVTAVASLTSMATTNLGGFGIGMMAGLIGSSMAFGWMPGPAPAEPDTPGSGREDADRAEEAQQQTGPAGDTRPHAAAGVARVTGAAGTGRVTGAAAGTGRVARADARRGLRAAGREGDLPKACEDRARPGRRHGRARGAVLFAVSTVLAAAALPAAAGTAGAAAGTAGAAPAQDLLPVPWPTINWPWETPATTPAPTGTGPAATPSASATASTSASAAASPSGGATHPGDDSPGGGKESGTDSPAADGPDRTAKGAQVTLPCITGVDTGGLPDPDQSGDDAEPGEAVPGRMPDDPDDLTALRPPIVLGGQPGRPRATYPVNTVYPEVGADSLTAYGAIIHGATYLTTADGGRMKVLWVHADRLVADNYSFRLDTGGQTQTIDVDLDIPQVDIYVTVLTGSITIPVIDVSTPRICIGADLVPANLPIAVQLPQLSVTAVEAGQVLVDAETVNFSDLSAHSRPR
ncbi:DUF6114 domain-containing protein [Streptomyces sp. NPDC020490]|uniref:DUF6114 domain-containing protein n=1 Tax=Streptomyces sp. NPDC020490 TaxID=3365078 RepID=UPI0037B7D14D